MLTARDRAILRQLVDGIERTPGQLQRGSRGKVGRFTVAVALTMLERDGLVAAHALPTVEGLPPRRVYTITAAGAAALTTLAPLPRRS